MRNFFEIDIKAWREIHVLADALRIFAFRGQPESSWELNTSLERCFNKFNPIINIYENSEHWMLNEFKEKFHLYSDNPPDTTNNFEWLALLQHYGCPTRLLDFTTSLYIASYFAFSESVDTSSIWAINLPTLRKRLHKELKLEYKEGEALKDEVNQSHIGLINRFIANQNINDDSPYFVVPLSSTKKSIRLSRQQGLFLAPINLDGFAGEYHFMKNLSKSYGSDEKINFLKIKITDFKKSGTYHTPYDSIDILKINIPINIQKESILSLNNMNITEETLFPGLDGLARSLINTVIR